MFLTTFLRDSQAASTVQWRVIVDNIISQQVSDTLVKDLDTKINVFKHLV